jgi:hypothetical protein
MPVTFYCMHEMNLDALNLVKWQACILQLGSKLCSSVSVVTVHSLDYQGSIPFRMEIFSSLLHRGQLWGPLSLIHSGQQGGGVC